MSSADPSTDSRAAGDAASDASPQSQPKTEISAGHAPDRDASNVVWGAVSAIGVLLAGIIGCVALALLGWAVDNPEGASAGSAMQVGLQGWFLAHGVPLPVAWGTLSLPPLLASAGIAYLFYRSGRSTARSLGIVSLRDQAEVAAAYAISYATVSIMLTSLAYPAGGIGLWHVGIAAVGFALIPTSLGLLVESGTGTRLLERLPGPAYAYLPGMRAGLLAAIGVSALLIACSLIINFSEASAIVAALAPGSVAGLSIIGISLLYLPNGLLSVLLLGSGAGFEIGSQTSIGLTAVSRGSLPAFPLLAALPHGWSLLVWSAVLAPIAAAVLATLASVRRLEAEDRTVPGLFSLAGAIALAGAATVGLLAWFAGGALGDGTLASVGTPPLTAFYYTLALTFVVSTGTAFYAARGRIGSAQAAKRSKAMETLAEPAPKDKRPRRDLKITSKRGLRRLTRSAPAPRAGGASAPSATLSIVQRARAERAERAEAELHAADPEPQADITEPTSADKEHRKAS
ncbi:cell division protein PerM [Epidermidibacterium keratini]|uniref:cell division protein PerM n=1 Tax=Epidermidibacterium keratini TaxID=1891644 RepID=UPI001CEF68D7|nr:DUF6350 family protein [Epidermidibacterium keratini]